MLKKYERGSLKSKLFSVRTIYLAGDSCVSVFPYTCNEFLISTQKLGRELYLFKVMFCLILLLTL